MTETITVVIETFTQTGPDTFKDVRYARNFSAHRPISDILKWAENMGIPDPTINSVKLCDYTGSSL